MFIFIKGEPGVDGKEGKTVGNIVFSAILRIKDRGIIIMRPSAAAIRQLTTDNNLGLGVDFTEGGKPENPGEKPSKHGRDQLQHLYMSSKFFSRINTRLYPVVKGNALTASAPRAPIKARLSKNLSMMS